MTSALGIPGSSAPGSSGSTRRRSRKVRSIVVRVMVFLLLGAVVNVGVAWGSAMLIQFDMRSYLEGNRGAVLDGEHNYQHWLLRVDKATAASRVTSQWVNRELRIRLVGMFPENRPETLIPKWADLARPTLASTGRGTYHYRWIDARGWPLLCIWSAIACDSIGNASSDAVTVVGGIAIDQPTLGSMRAIGSGQRFIPLRPTWPGFAINTLFYATIFWLLFALPFTLRRWRRIQRGLCAKCAYPVGASEVCTECGAALLMRSHKSRARQ